MSSVFLAGLSSETLTLGDATESRLSHVYAESLLTSTNIISYISEIHSESVVLPSSKGSVLNSFYVEIISLNTPYSKKTIPQISICL
jgi:hypothetical protein